MYAVVADTRRSEEEEKKRATRRADQRPKLGLVSVKRLELPRRWFVTLFKDPDALALRSEPMEERLPDFAIVTDASPQGIGAILATIDHNVGQTFTILEALEIPVLEEDAKRLGVPWKESASQGDSRSLGGEVGLPQMGASTGGQERGAEERQRGGFGNGKTTVLTIASHQLDWGRIGN